MGEEYKEHYKQLPFVSMELCCKCLEKKLCEIEHKFLKNYKICNNCYINLQEEPKVTYWKIFILDGDGLIEINKKNNKTYEYCRNKINTGFPNIPVILIPETFNFKDYLEKCINLECPERS
jgi:hypothetical protein